MGRVRRLRARPLGRREALAGFLFVSPWLIALVVFHVYPIVAATYLSLSDYNIFNPPEFQGFDNYVKLWNDPTVWKAAGNSLFYALLSVPIGLAAALVLALLLNRPVRGIGIHRTLFYMPAVVPPVAGTIVFLLLLEPRAGPLNTAIETVGIDGPAWFQDPAFAKWGLIILSLWGVGAATLIFLAGLQEIPESLLEAASIDGAGAWRRFTNVTLPLLTPVILFNLVIGVIYSFQVFDAAMIVGGTSGVPGGSTLMYMVHIYRTAFGYFDMGYASAQAMVLFLVIVAVTGAIFGSTRRWVYEGV
ncbi:MAG: sugar ABC transporter permease [Acidimicrobiia bacterium]|nr:sugar ABC transporter permease [bacterium]MXW69304.1 sugar ABC transporter permease [Acidimicrobiia bacterium]MDE0675196.1 sugar ABC transporter permease [bacterium]MXX00338.1 sugar ABC transporter permease [Acidimicrobiia bacterium]MXX46040.1 sugar ABC transporter permease [Acidimicrobiia bacterium]